MYSSYYKVQKYQLWLLYLFNVFILQLYVPSLLTVLKSSSTKSALIFTTVYNLPIYFKKFNNF